MHIRRSADRGGADHGWLRTRHSFAFADYDDPAWRGWGNLRVLNEDRIAPGAGFGRHGHRDMEIVSWVLDGALAHADSLGHGGASGVIRPGDAQHMSAGTGVAHSEHNALDDRWTHFLQIWLLPRERGVAPAWSQQHFPAAERRGRLRLVASPHGREGSIAMNADAAIRTGLFDGAESAELALDPARKGWVHVARGRIDVNGEPLAAGDAAAIEGASRLRLDRGTDAEVLVFDLAPG